MNEKWGEMSYQLNHFIYRGEHGLTAAGQRAADQRIGELAAGLAGLRQSMAGNVRLALGAMRGLGKPKCSRRQANSGVVAPAGY